MAGMTKDRAKVLKAKTDLYDVLLDNCGNGLVKETLTSLHSRINLLRATSLMDPQRLPVSINEIDDLYQALKARDPDAAERHVANAKEVALRILEETNAT